jgi:hypothetical protein
MVAVVAKTVVHMPFWGGFKIGHFAMPPSLLGFVNPELFEPTCQQVVHKSPFGVGSRSIGHFAMPPSLPWLLG